MNTIDAMESSNNRNQTLRLLMLLIIVGTFPFYCLGVVIIGSAPAGDSQGVLETLETEDPDATFTPLGGDLTASPTPTVTTTRLVTATQESPLQPTPFQYIPPTRVVATSTPIPTVFIPSPTNAPTLTPSIGDQDSDGIRDDRDNCPNVFGPADNNGCPYEDDPDRDNIRGNDDKCPNFYAPDNPRGCPDTDGDGLDDSQDNCPNQSGPRNNNGCPNVDTDGDGINDRNDSCPNRGDEGNGIDSSGCPNPVDSDGDGINDSEDACPQQGDQGNGVDSDGCPNDPPPADSDGDGIIDDVDLCPNQGDEGNGIDADGCPIEVQDPVSGT